MIAIGFALFLTAHGLTTPISSIYSTEEECLMYKQEVNKVKPDADLTCIQMFVEDK